MTEQEWLTAGDIGAMLRFLRSTRKASRRKLRLFCCACCRRIWPFLIDEKSRRAVIAAEQYADGYIEEPDLKAIWDAAVPSNLEFVQKSWSARTQAELRHAESQAADAAWNAVTPNDSPAFGMEEADASIVTDLIDEGSPLPSCELLRHIVGSPFKPCPAPGFWPSTVIQLADALYNGQDCGFALHDALLEAGHPELAEHFQKEAWHPKGCWILDEILGME